MIAETIAEKLNPDIAVVTLIWRTQTHEKLRPEHTESRFRTGCVGGFAAPHGRPGR
jgi:hypothetical protein